jgi:hypothetical protein
MCLMLSGTTKLLCSCLYWLFVKKSTIKIKVGRYILFDCRVLRRDSERMNIHELISP